ncbi:hypothetical protein TNCV_377021 [Trichonephila clavipes]|nr:hypothetical protein TNCV_377021 [Trichonephila clavipes]
MSSGLSPNENTPTTAYEAKTGFIRKENRPPMITRSADMLTYPLHGVKRFLISVMENIKSYVVTELNFAVYPKHLG